MENPSTHKTKVIQPLEGLNDLCMVQWRRSDKLVDQVFEIFLPCTDLLWLTILVRQ